MHIRLRPDSFEEVIGNKAIIKSLKSQLKKDIIRPILFEGIRGCGKTTLAYIVAKEFGASEYNIIDRDCVNYSKKDDMRGLMKEFTDDSLFQEKRVLVLDEIHAIKTEEAQQILLKPLEDKNLDNTHLYIACTTKTEGVVATVLDRFIRYRVKPLSQEEGLLLINRACEKEKISIPKWLKVLILKHSQGIPRNILTGLSAVEGMDDEEEARYLLALSSIENKEIFDLFRMILSDKISWDLIKSTLNNLLSKDSPNDIRIGLMNLTGDKMLSNYFKESEGDKLTKGYKLLYDLSSIPNKANLVIGVYNFYKIMRG